MNGCRVLSVVFGCLLAAGIASSGTSAAADNIRSALEANRDTAATWKVSPVAADCIGPSDAQGHLWYETDFDDVSWTDLQPPDVGSIPSGQDRYYRLHYAHEVSGTTQIRLSTDDGVWLYVNGAFVGHWGADCHGGGRADSVVVDITSYLHPGDNLIAAHVSNGTGNSLFDLKFPPRIILPMDSRVGVEFVSTSTSCTGSFGMYSPQNIPIYQDYKYQGGVTFPLGETFSVGTELIFYIIPRDFCGGYTYLSTDPTRAIVDRLNDYTWRISWEDWTDGDFNDLVVEVRLGGAVAPQLELPFDYSGSTFVRAASDLEMGGTVNAYFDHHYPNYARDGRVVTFHGYDNQFDSPAFGLAYDGHDGIDFAVSGSAIPVLAAADGHISDIVPASPGSCSCCIGGTCQTIAEACLGNHVVIAHTAGLTTTYGHLSSFSPDIREGDVIARGTRLGVMGTTGCSSGAHIHLQVSNAQALPVDPFGWMPFPDSTYHQTGDPDPWWQYNNNLVPQLDATSHYLWIHPLDRRVLNNPDAPTVITSASGEITAAFPIGAHQGAYRIELWEILDNPELANPSARPVSAFALYAFDEAEEPIWSVLQPVALQFATDTGNQAMGQALGFTPEYVLYSWNNDSDLWEPLLTTYDPLTGVVSATSENLGRFAVARIDHLIFLPIVLRSY
jgi:murein DD-endopeptidase MepM/ murein hydrolase activator NlpD